MAMCGNSIGQGDEYTDKKDPMLHGMQTVMINQNPMGLLYMDVLTVGVVRYFACLSQGRKVMLITSHRIFWRLLKNMADAQ